MKRSVKIALLAAGILVVLGLVLMLVAAFALGGPDRLEDRLEDYFENHTVGISVVRKDNADESYWESYESSNVYEVETRNVTSLFVDWAAGRVEITPWEKDSIQIAEVAERDIAQVDALRWRVDESGCLIIEDGLNRKGITVNPLTKYLQIMVPEELAANWQTIHVSSASAPVIITGMTAVKLDVSTASGDVKLTELTAETVSLDAASGDIAFTGVYDRLQVGTASGDVRVESLGSARETEIETASGCIEVSGDCGNLSLDSASGDMTATAVTARRVDVDTASGKVTLELLSCPMELDVETTSGDVKLTLPADSGFRLEFEHASGDLENSDFPLSRRGGVYIAGDGVAEFSVDTTSGDLRIYSH